MLPRIVQSTLKRNIWFKKKRKKFFNNKNWTNSLLSSLLIFSSHWLTAQWNFYWSLQDDSFRNCFYRMRLKVFEEKKNHLILFIFLSLPSQALIATFVPAKVTQYFCYLEHENSSLFISASGVFAHRRIV